MMITREEILHIADLARLTVTDEEAEKLSSQMGDIISAMDSLSEVNTENIEPTNHAVKVENVFREDEVSQKYSRDDLLDSAPSKQAGCYIVPKVVE